MTLEKRILRFCKGGLGIACLFLVVACNHSNPSLSLAEDNKANSNVASNQSSALVCSIISQAEMASLLSEPVIENVKQGPGGETHCEFTASSKSFQVQIETRNKAINSFDEFRKGAKSKEGFAGSPVKAVQGVGDEAYWLSGQFDEFSGGTLAVLKKK